MRRLRSIRLAATLITMFCLLFAQLAVAAYACPQLAPDAQAHAATEKMPGCPEMDKQSPTLCAAHTNPAPQTLDQLGQPQIPPFVPSGLVAELAKPERPLAAEMLVTAADLETAGSGPPLAIRHCCFRI